MFVINVFGRHILFHLSESWICVFSSGVELQKQLPSHLSQTFIAWNDRLLLAAFGFPPDTVCSRGIFWQSVDTCHAGCQRLSPHVFVPCCRLFFRIWPLAMSQQQRSEVSTPRHNSLSGKNNSLMPQPSYVVWDDSESRETHCLDVFVVQVHCSRNVGISSLVCIFRSVCEFKKAVQAAVQCGVQGWGPYLCSSVGICSYDSNEGVWVNVFWKLVYCFLQKTIAPPGTRMVHQSPIRSASDLTAQHWTQSENLALKGAPLGHLGVSDLPG